VSVRNPADAASRMFGYALAAAGPFMVAIANFALSYSTLRLESSIAFGTFAFLFAAATFLIALAGALFGAPMQALYHGSGEATSSVVCAAALAAMLAGPIYALLGFAMGLGLPFALCYGIFSALTVLRSVGRAWCYLTDRRWRVTRSDATYAVVTVGTFAATRGLGGMAARDCVYLALGLGSLAATAALGRGFAAEVWRSRRARLHDYRAIWHDQSRWSLLGVSANEAAANAHLYLLALLAGTATVAPIAASALLMRPINVVQNAMTDFERARIAQSLATRAFDETHRSVRLFRHILLLLWGGTVIVAALILSIRPELITPAGYEVGSIMLATTLWAAVWLIIAIQVPHNVLLQAAGDFRTLARASVCAAVVSVAGMLIAIAAGHPIWTVAALAPGWLVSTIMIFAATRYLHQREMATAAGLEVPIA
jgi:hypothetical protein